MDYGRLILKNKDLIHFEAEKANNSHEIIEFFAEEEGVFYYICEILSGDRADEFRKMIIKYLYESRWEDYLDLQSQTNRRRKKKGSWMNTINK